MYCKYLSKTFQNGFKCKLYKKYINYPVCTQNCPNFNVVRNKGINKVGKKRIFVKPEIYDQVFKRDKGKCRLCGTSYNLHLHHIKYRSESKNLINEPNNCIMLCDKCHKIVHSNKKKWQPILLNLKKL